MTAVIPPFFCPCIFLGGSLGSEPSSGPDKDSHRTKAAWVLDPWIRGRPSALPVWEMVVDEKGAGSTDFHRRSHRLHVDDVDRLGDGRRAIRVSQLGESDFN